MTALEYLHEHKEMSFSEFLELVNKNDAENNDCLTLSDLTTLYEQAMYEYYA